MTSFSMGDGPTEKGLPFHKESDSSSSDSSEVGIRQLQQTPEPMVEIWYFHVFPPR